MSPSREGDEFEVLLRLCETVGSVKALGVSICVRYRLVDDYLALKLDPESYASPKAFADDYMLLTYLKKYVGWGIKPKVLANRALDGWKASERECLRTNTRLTSVHPENPDGDLIFRTRRKIAEVLGVCSVGRILERCDWSGGATYDHSRGHTVAEKMIKLPLSVTSGALPYAAAFIAVDYHWAECILGVHPSGPFCMMRTVFEVVPGNRFITVAKDAKTDRCINIEPTMNIFLQKGVGAHIRTRLRRFGIELNDQGVNQRLCKEAFRKKLATLDLSAASDSIAWQVVALLLPIDWLSLLDDLRSHRAYVDGSWITVEKFSSMGNGFTFELETLIFWAICSSVIDLMAVRPDDPICSVYGDDIIVNDLAYEPVCRALRAFGFTVNMAKSFSGGPFFESCGKHYFEGVDVTPVYQKKRYYSSLGVIPLEHIRAVNRLHRWSMRVHNRPRCQVVKKAIRTLMRITPFEAKKLPRQPFGSEGDMGYLSEPSQLIFDPSNGYYCYLAIEYAAEKKVEHLPMFALYLRRSRFSLNQELSHVSERSGRFRLRWQYMHLSGLHREAPDEFMSDYSQQSEH